MAGLPGRPHLDRVIVATQARGTVLIFEKMFESRLFFVDKLVSMGARIILCDPHRAVVTGPAQLVRPADVEPRHPRRDGDAARRALRRGHVDDRQHRRDRPRLRAHRRAPALARRPDRARRDLMARTGQADEAGQAACARRRRRHRPRRTSTPGCPCSTTCSGCSPSTRRFDLVLEIAPGERRGRGRGGGRALGQALADACARRGAPRPRVGCRCRPTRRSRTSSSRPRGRPLRRLERRSARRPGRRARQATSSRRSSAARRGRRADAARPADRRATTPEHVLEAMFKALGVALGAELPPRRRKEE